MRRLSASALALALLLSGCGGQAPQRSTDSTPPAGKADGHAAADVVPGSYEDWCDEHAVAETACTRCDPSRIAAFKAIGDWDPEHGLPRSQCTTCDPSLKIVRPPQAEAN